MSNQSRGSSCKEEEGNVCEKVEEIPCIKEVKEGGVGRLWGTGIWFFLLKTTVLKNFNPEAGRIRFVLKKIALTS